MNFITDFRKSPNEIKTHQDLLTRFGASNEPVINQLLTELQQTKVLRQTTSNGEKAYQVVTK